MQLSILGNELARFDQEVDRGRGAARTLLRQRVANFYYVLYLTGGAPSRFLHLLSAFITWMTAVMIPLALLLWIQIRFLPFHSPLDTWLHRAAIVVDAGLILFILLPRLWPRLRAMREGCRLAGAVPSGGLRARLHRARLRGDAVRLAVRGDDSGQSRRHVVVRAEHGAARARADRQRARARKTSTPCATPAIRSGSARCSRR